MENTKLNELLKLPTEEKLELVYAIWDSIRDDVTKSEIPVDHKTILDGRLKKIENGEATFQNWEEIKKKYL